MKIDDGIKWVKQYYQFRREQNQIVEKKNCIYLKVNITDEEIRQNLISNPIKALTSSSYFTFDESNQNLIFSPELWSLICSAEKTDIVKTCKQRLEKYYSS